MLLIILTFGSALVPLIYLVSTAFSDTVTAGKCIAPILIIAGNILPLMILPWVLAIGWMASEGAIVFITAFLYFTNPFATFFVNSYQVIVHYFIEQAVQAVTDESASTEDLEGLKLFCISGDKCLEASPGMGIVANLIQAFFFFTITVLIEHHRA
jgi:hypothetical protein